MRPIIDASLKEVVDHLSEMERSGRVKLRLSPMQTALAIAALKDGLVWFALARDRPLSEAGNDVKAIVDCLIAT